MDDLAHHGRDIRRSLFISAVFLVGLSILFAVHTRTGILSRLERAVIGAVLPHGK